MINDHDLRAHGSDDRFLVLMSGVAVGAVGGCVIGLLVGWLVWG